MACHSKMTSLTYILQLQVQKLANEYPAGKGRPEENQSKKITVLD
jgi:hypothetical protein